MPLDILSTAFFDGPESIPGWNYIKTYGPILLTTAGIKYYFGGSYNIWDRDLHGKVFMITGGTSGVGGAVAHELARQGAQIVLLVRSTNDQWLIDYVDDMRDKTNNFMIYAEQCDLNSLYSIRKFCTQWLDNKPPRRLDGIICCAAESIPIGKPRQMTVDGIEKQIGVNYLAHYHLLTLLGPAIRSQPPDRDVRIAVASCATQAIGEIDINDLLWESRQYPSRSPLKIYGTSKLLLGLFVKEYQRQIDSYERKDKKPTNVRINVVNPGVVRSPSTRRFLSFGSVLGLVVYLLLYPIWFLFFKSSFQGAQSFFFAVSAPILARVEGGNLIQECKILRRTREEFQDEELQGEIFRKTEALLADIEKRSAIERKKHEKLQESRKPKAQKKKEREAETKRKNDIYEKPETPEELEAKLSVLRSSLPNKYKDEPPLLPTESKAKSKKKASK